MLTSDKTVATPKEFLVISITVYKDDSDREKKSGSGEDGATPGAHLANTSLFYAASTI